LKLTAGFAAGAVVAGAAGFGAGELPSDAGATGEADPRVITTPSVNTPAPATARIIRTSWRGIPPGRAAGAPAPAGVATAVAGGAADADGAVDADVAAAPSRGRSLRAVSSAMNSGATVSTTC
jgi:hypothetical protein